ncbi:hypothetical protein GCM10025760_06540 [Microbacterium yannicii]|uniref:Fumarylacetoacetase-like C-terminal domain-containing protein n=1 Tax=Microbacterium yannicii TaxID=671622 RepID=A0ABP9LZM2_9MICO
MRIARWSHENIVGEGFVIDDRVVAFPEGATVADILAGGRDAAHAAFGRVHGEAGTPLDSVRLLAPVVPASVRDFVAFEEHVEGVSAGVEGKSHVADEWYEAPTFYFTNPHTILGPDDVLQPPVTERLDFELEVAVVIGASTGSATGEPGSATGEPGSATGEPGSATGEPGSATGEPGSATGEPGSATGEPGSATGEPGSATGEPGSATGEPGSATGEPGSATGEPGSATGEPGSATGEPGSATGEPGSATGEPGSATGEPGSATGEPGSATGWSNLTVEDAASVIFGYTIMNDWSARDLQGREMKVRLGPAKGKDFGTALGPWIVTADELEPYLDADGFLAIRAEVYINGELTGEDLVSNAGWPFPEFVAYASRNSRVVPGDVLGSGTVGNGGCLGELWGRNGGLVPPPLAEGDEVRMVVEGIGELVGVVGAAVPAPVVPPARPRPRLRRREEQ